MAERILSSTRYCRAKRDRLKKSNFQFKKIKSNKSFSLICKFNETIAFPRYNGSNKMAWDGLG